MSFVRKIKKGKSTYLAKVESYRKDGKVKQRVLEYIGKEENGKVIPKKRTFLDFNIIKVTQYLDIKAINDTANDLEIIDILGKGAKYIAVMIYSHLLEKISIYKMPEWAERTEILNILKVKKITTKDLYESLTSLSEIDFEIIQKHVAQKLKDYEAGNRTAVLDITDTYFSGSRANWKSRRGKDGKYDKLIQIALAVSFTNGFPIMHKVYEGNISNIKIFEDMINDLKIYGYDSIVVDRGMGSKKNIDNVHEYGLHAILGLRLTSKIGATYISCIRREEIFTKNCQVELKETKVYIRGFDYMKGRLIAIYNPNIEVVRMEKLMEANPQKPIDKYAGYSVIYHNTDITDKEVVKKYFEKDIVERSFKQLKGPLSLHPLRVLKMTHINSHIKICYLAYAILSLIGYKVKSLGISAIDALHKLGGGYKVYLENLTDNTVIEKVVTIKKIQEQILNSLFVVYKN